MPGRSTRTVKLDLRLSPEAKRKLQTAAESTGRTVSEFTLESALVRADEALADSGSDAGGNFTVMKEALSKRADGATVQRGPRQPSWCH
jgi:hypothetical protein